VKQHLNTLYVTTDGAYLARQGENVLVRVDEETRLRLPVHTLGGIVCFGRVGCSPSLMGLCGERDVAISFLSRSGRFLARVQGPVSGNVLLRREQYHRSDSPEASAAIANPIVAAKIANSRTVLRRYLRDHPEGSGREPVEDAIRILNRKLDELGREPALSTVRGIEGEAARAYFAVFNHLIVAQKDSFAFTGRSRRPPTDSTNTLLSFLYVLLVHDVASALESVGLDPQVGYLHRDRPGRPSLALDLMEEFRTVLADRLALSLINRKQVAPKGFTCTETGAVRMDDATRKTVLVAWQKRKQEEIVHPYLQEQTTVGLLPFLQARLLARALRGDLDGYPPFIWK
jgi:CRISPR-associated protein Cas1